MLRKFVPAFFDMRFFASSSVIFAGSLVVNVLNYVFTLVMSRMLDIESFGEVAALMSLTLIVSVPAAALTMFMARELSASGDEAGARVYYGLRRTVVRGAFFAWVITLLASYPLSLFLHIPLAPLALFSFMVALSLFSSLQVGALQGLQEFFFLAKQNILGAALKLIGSVILVRLGFSVSGVVMALIVSQSASWWYSRTKTHARLVRAEEKAETAQLRAVFGTLFATSLLLVLLSNIDVLLAKHFLSATEAGHYGALSTVGKMLIYGVGAFVTVLLPLVSSAHSKSAAEGKKIFYVSLSVIGGASLCAVTIFSVAPELVIRILFGARYLDIAPYLGVFSVGMAAIALSTAFINYFLAVYDRTFLWFLGAGITVEAALLSLFHGSLIAVVYSMVVSAIVLFSLMVLNYVVFCRTQKTV